MKVKIVLDVFPGHSNVFSRQIYCLNTVYSSAGSFSSRLQTEPCVAAVYMQCLSSTDQLILGTGKSGFIRCVRQSWNIRKPFCSYNARHRDSHSAHTQFHTGQAPCRMGWHLTAWQPTCEDATNMDKRPQTPVNTAHQVANFGNASAWMCHGKRSFRNGAVWMYHGGRSFRNEAF